MNGREPPANGFLADLDSTTEEEKQDIVKFIEKESLSRKKQSDQVIIETYACCLFKGFFDMKHKLYNTPNLNVMHAIDMGIQLVDHLFWFLFHYSSNLQLTLFLTERGRLLYTEFLSMSRTHHLMKQMNSFPSITDGFMFAIKKSIGSLTCAEHHTKILLRNITAYRICYRKIFEIINLKYLVTDSECEQTPPYSYSSSSAAAAAAAAAAKKGGRTSCKPWNDDKINITLHRLNHLMSIAIEMAPDSFERCVQAPHNYSVGLSEFFLLLQLASDTICTHHHISPEHLQQLFLFIEEHRAYITPQEIDCLDESHYVQKQWREQRDQRGTSLVEPPAFQ